jgi:uncharacterized RDD family membrane protein YckC
MSDDKNSSDEMTPLERYLAKQKASGGQTEPALAHDPAIEAGAPAFPPSQPLPPLRSSSTSSTSDSRFTPAPETTAISQVPADFWPRVGAFLIDAVIVSFLSGILTAVSSAAFFFLPHMFFGFWPLSRLVIIFFYYGWFYAERGASPGKLLLGLEIREAGTGRRLGYIRTFLRETIGKMISGAILGIGFIIVAFRKDRRALHDMMFDTRVFQRVTKV